jgi:hypothetical protein
MWTPLSAMHNCNFSTLLSIGMCFMWLLGKVPVFQLAYSEHLQRLEDDTWLQDQCRDPQFFTRMRQHTDVCEHVRASFQQPAILVGLQACIPMDVEDFLPALEWQTWAADSVVMLLLIPNVLLPLYRASEDRREQTRVMKACSPILPTNYCFAANKLSGF